MAMPQAPERPKEEVPLEKAFEIQGFVAKPKAPKEEDLFKSLEMAEKAIALEEGMGSPEAKKNPESPMSKSSSEDEIFTKSIPEEGEPKPEIEAIELKQEVDSKSEGEQVLEEPKPEG
jgi:hypothetical protein